MTLGMWSLIAGMGILLVVGIAKWWRRYRFPDDYRIYDEYDE